MRLVASRPNGTSAPRPDDQIAFDDVYEKYSEAIFNFVLRSVRNYDEAQDICQEIWLAVHRHLTTLRQAESCRPWLYRVATTACIDAARKGSRAAARVPLTETQPSRGGVEETVTDSERTRLAWQALAALPPRQHMALFLKAVEGQSYREITEALNTSEDGVADLLYRARRSLATAYKKLEPSSEGRCRLAKTAIAALVDGEVTKVQTHALRAHVEDCHQCRSELPAQQTAMNGYAGLALVAVPSGFLGRVLAAVGAGEASASGTLSAIQLLGAGFVKSNIIGLTAATAVIGGVAFAGYQAVPETNAPPPEQSTVAIEDPVAPVADNNTSKLTSEVGTAPDSSASDPVAARMDEAEVPVPETVVPPGAVEQIETLLELETLEVIDLAEQAAILANIIECSQELLEGVGQEPVVPESCALPEDPVEELVPDSVPPVLPPVIPEEVPLEEIISVDLDEVTGVDLEDNPLLPWATLPAPRCRNRPG
jgi:RNA polymerase sigma-70 factor (ECF subfamily)